MEQEISLLDLWKLFRKYFVRIAGMTLIGAALAVAFMILFVDRQYESDAQLLVNQSQSQDSGVQFNDIQTNINLVNTYRDMIRGNAILEEVNENLGNVFTISELREAITVEQSQNSQAFYISATMASPTDAQNVVNTTVDVFRNTIIDVYNEDVSSIYVMSAASYNPNAVSPSLVIYALIGGMLGFIIMVGIALVMELMDTRIKSADDLTSMGLTRLAEINELTPKQVKQNRFKVDNEELRSRRRV